NGGSRQEWPTCQVDPLRTNDVRVNKTVYRVTSRSRPVRDPLETAARGADTRTSEQPAAPDTRRTPRPDHLTAARRAQARCPRTPRSERSSQHGNYHRTNARTSGRSGGRPGGWFLWAT